MTEPIGDHSTDAAGGLHEQYGASRISARCRKGSGNPSRRGAVHQDVVIGHFGLSRPKRRQSHGQDDRKEGAHGIALA